jgi:hypothetical protein
METNDKWAELRKPLSMRKLTAEQMCNEFLTELQVANKNLQYGNKHMFENDRFAACSIDFHDPKLEEFLSKKGLTDAEKTYGTRGSLEVSYTKSMPERGYEADMKLPFILTGHPDTKLISMKKVGGFVSNEQCKITGLHVYKESTPTIQVNVACSSFNRVNDVIKYINEASSLSRNAARMK